MRTSLENMCEIFIQNRDTIKDTFKWDNPYIISVCASALCGKNVTTEADKLEACKKIIEKKTGVLSIFRGNVKLPTITMLACSDNPEQKFDNVMAIYEVLKKHFKESNYLALLSTILTNMISVADVEKYAERGKRIYKLMKREHPFLTSSEDSVFAVLMAFSDQEDNELITDMEACYTTMKKDFLDANSVQSLSHILSMTEGTATEKCAHVSAIYEELNNSGKKYGKSYELSVLGSLSLLSSDVKSIVEDMVCVDSFLEKQKGYGGLGLDKKTRLMHAAMIVASDYSKENTTNAAAITSTLAMVATQQAAMCAALATATVTASSN